MSKVTREMAFCTGKVSKVSKLTREMAAGRTLLSTALADLDACRREAGVCVCVCAGAGVCVCVSVLSLLALLALL